MIYNPRIKFTSFNAAEGRKIVQHMNNHCSKTLKNLDLNYVRGDVLDELKNTFTEIEIKAHIKPHLFEVISETVLRFLIKVEDFEWNNAKCNAYAKLSVWLK